MKINVGDSLKFWGEKCGYYSGVVTAREGNKFVIHWDDEPSNPFIFAPSVVTLEEILEGLAK